MEAQDYFDAYIAKRGISKELAEARGYRPWDGTTGAEIIAEGFEGLHRGGLQWLQGIASNEDENGVGFTIPRRPIPLDGVNENTFPDWFDHGHIFPGIKTEEAVKTGTKRHFHGHYDTVFSLLPTQVIGAMCKPTMGQFAAQFHTLHFDHTHEGMEEAELTKHMRIWHGVSRFRTEHHHSVRIFKPETMSDHVSTKSGKLTNAHLGENTDEIHVHVQKAKYLYAPHPYGEPVSWDIEHDHSGMDEEALKWHLETKHQHEEE